MNTMRRFGTIAALMAVLLPLGTPAAAWAVEQCCSNSPLAAVAAASSASSGSCHEAASASAALTPCSAAHGDDAASSDSCRMDHLGIRAAANDQDIAVAAQTVVPSQAGFGRLPLVMRAAALDREPPPSADLTILNGILRI